MNKIPLKNPIFNFKKAIFVFLILTIFIIIIDMKYRYEFWFNSTFYMFLIVIFCPVFIAISFSIELFILKRIDLSKFVLLIPVACLLGPIIGSQVIRFQADLSKEAAQTIILAIESYETHYGKCPENLSDLVPEYLGEIPLSKTGWFDIPYEYNCESHMNYSIEFPSESESVWIYNSRSKIWIVTQK